MAKKNNMKKQIDIKRENFMRSDNPASTKGSIYDPVSSQTTGSELVLTQQQIDVLYNDNAFCKRLIRDIAKDSIKSGFKVMTGDTEDEEIMKRWEELELSDYVVDLLTYGQKDGIAFLYPVLEGTKLETGEELNLNSVNKILDFNLFYARDLNTMNRQLDKVKPMYGYISSCEFKNTYGEVTNLKIDGSWLTEYEPYKRDDKFNKTGKEYGDSFYKGIWDLLVVKDNGIWSVGQLAYAMLLKVLKIGDQNQLNNIINEMGKDKYQKKRELEINTSTLSIIGKDDSIEGVNFTSGLNIKDLKEYIYEEISMATSIPLSKLKGAASGALASSTEDSKRWYEYVEGFQSDDLDQIIRQLIKLLYAEKGKYDQDFKIVFNSIRTVDKKEAAEIGKLEAEQLKILGETLVNLNNNVKDNDIATLLEDFKGKLSDKFANLLGD